MKHLKLVLVSVVLISIVLVMFFPIEVESYPKPLKAKDTDGTPSDEIINNTNSGFETVILKFNPFGYIEVQEWEKVDFLKKVYVVVEWKAYKDLGAGNIYIGYSFDGKNYTEIGPFNESDEVKTEIIEIPANFSDISKLRIRFRGEDLDFATDAIAEVKILLKVTKYNFGLI